MKKIILYIAASLDQRIAEPDGSLEWLTGVPNPQKTNNEYKDLLDSVDTVLIGGRTYRELLNMEVIWPYQEQMTYVVSRHNWGDEDNIHFITNNIIENISALRNELGKDILLVGGGELTSMLLAADLVDEMRITYIPVILGNGIPLFPEQSKESKWELIKCKNYSSSIVKVEYQKKDLSCKKSKSIILFMAEDKPRLVRLAAILTQLQSKRIVTATEIAEKHNVSVRTIYRDIRTLEQSGIPIITEEGKGYSIMAGYTLPPIMLTQEEANALITAEQLILKNRDTSLVEYYQNAIMKVKSVMKFSQKERVDFLSSRMQIRNELEQGTSNYLIQLQTAVVNYQVVKITYVSLENQTSERFIEPFAVYTTHENWVIVAFCRLRKDFRAFRLDCIQDMEMINKHFEPHKITLEQYLEKCRKKFMDTPDIPLSYE